MRRASTQNRHYTRRSDATIRGPQVFAALQHSQAEVRNNLHELEKSSKQFDEKMEHLVAQRSEEFVELARHYLPDLSTETVEQNFIGTRQELRSLLREKRHHEKELSDSIELARKAVLQAQSETDRVTTALNQKVEQRDHLQAAVADRLKEMPDYQKLTNDAALAERRLTQNEERLEQVNQEASQKLPSYENSRLFMYLYRRHYGTPDYKTSGLFKRLDRSLAKFIRYAKAKRSYDFMKATPALMANELDRRRHQFNELMNQIETIESKTENEVGLTAIIEQGEQLGLQRDELVNQIEDQNRQIDRDQIALSKSQDSKGEHYQAALDKLKKHLEETESALLRAHAKQTPEHQDDHMIQEIVLLNKLIGDLKPEILSLIGKRNSLLEKQAGLDDIVRRFRSSNFDSNRSVFPDNFEIGRLIGRFMNNAIGQKKLWRQIRQNQKFQESWAQQTSTDVLNNPSAQVVLHTMLDLASKTLRNSAQRSVYRRNSSTGGGISWPTLPSSPSPRRRSTTRQSSTRRRSKPRQRRGGFTSGDGF